MAQPSLPSGSPILSPQQIESAQAGLDALARGVDDVNKLATEVSKGVGEAQSGATLYADSLTLQERKQEARLRIGTAKSPEEIMPIVQEYEKTALLMADNSNLNTKDTGTFAQLAAGDIDKVMGYGVDTEVRMLRNINRKSILGSEKTNLERYQEMLLDNPKQAPLFAATQRQTFEDAYSAGLITEDQKNNGINAYTFLQEKATKLFNNVHDGNAMAWDYHQGTPLSTKDVADMPSSEIVNKFHLDRTKDVSYDQWKADLSNGNFDAEAFMNFDKHTVAKAEMAFEGINKANAMFKSNQPIELVQARLDKLNNAPGGILTEEERSERSQLELGLKSIEKNFLGFMVHTSKGALIARDYQDDINGINNSINTDAQKAQMTRDAFNRSVGSITELAVQQGFGYDNIKPARAEDVLSINSAFKVGGNPQDVIKTIDQYNPVNVPWVANSIDNPVDREVVMAAGYVRGTKSDAHIEALIAANQKGMNFSALNSKAEGTGGVEFAGIHWFGGGNNAQDAKIKNAITASLGNTLNYMKALPNGGQRTNAMVESLTKYVKYRAIQNQDFSVSNLNDYANEGAKIYNDAYQVKAGNGYSFPTNQVNISDSDMKNIVGYMNDRVKEKANGANISPYTVTYLPSNEIAAVDNNGTVLYSQPFSNALLMAAGHEQDKRNNVSIESKRVPPPAPTIKNPINPITGQEFKDNQ